MSSCPWERFKGYEGTDRMSERCRRNLGDSMYYQSKWLLHEARYSVEVVSAKYNGWSGVWLKEGRRSCRRRHGQVV